MFHLRTTPSTVTGKTPAELLNGRIFKTIISAVHPDTANSQEKRQEDIQNKKRFKIGDNVLMRLYNVEKKWQRGVIVGMQEPAVYEAESEGGGRHRRHVDQLLKTRPPHPPTWPENENEAYDYHDDDELEREVIIPPPEEWNEIIGC